MQVKCRPPSTGRRGIRQHGPALKQLLRRVTFTYSRILPCSSDHAHPVVPMDGLGMQLGCGAFTKSPVKLKRTRGYHHPGTVTSAL